MANRIKELRDAMGWSQEELGAKVNTTGQQIGKLEKEQRDLNPRWMQLIGNALGVDPCDLLIFEHTGLDPDRVIFPLKYWDRLRPSLQRSYLNLIKDQAGDEVPGKEQVENRGIHGFVNRDPEDTEIKFPRRAPSGVRNNNRKQKGEPR